MAVTVVLVISNKEITDMGDFKREKLNCLRGNVETFIAFEWDNSNHETPLVECWIKTNAKKSVWERIETAVKYVFNNEATLDYIVLGKQHSYQLQTVATFLKGKKT